MKGPGGNNMKVGVVSDINPKKATCRVRFPDFDGLQSYWLPVLQKKTCKDKSYWLPDKDEHVLCILDDNAEFGVILGAIYSDKDPPPVESPDKRHVIFDDGTWIEYDRKTNCLSGQVMGTVDLEVSGSVRIKCPTIMLEADQVQLSGDLTVGGNIIAVGNIFAVGSIIDGAGNTNHHSH